MSRLSVDKLVVLFPENQDEVETTTTWVGITLQPPNKRELLPGLVETYVCICVDMPLEARGEKFKLYFCISAFNLTISIPKSWLMWISYIGPNPVLAHHCLFPPCFWDLLFPDGKDSLSHLSNNALGLKLIYRSMIQQEIEIINLWNNTQLCHSVHELKVS